MAVHIPIPFLLIYYLHNKTISDKSIRAIHENLSGGKGNSILIINMIAMMEKCISIDNWHVNGWTE